METPFSTMQTMAVFGVLAFLGTGFLLLAAGATVAALWVAKRGVLARRIGQWTLAGTGLYLGTLLVFSLASRERVLAPQQEKYFCEIDCHLAYSVLDVAKTKARSGTSYAVQLKTRFDETTISPGRGNGPLAPNPRLIRVIDDVGREFEVTIEGTPMGQALRPGESYMTTLVFDLPTDIKNPRLLLTETIFPTLLLIGHENSLLHKKTSFRLN